MVTTDFLIQGLDSPSLPATISGTGHFRNNIASAWYQVDELVLSGEEAIISFMPTNDIPEEYRSCAEYSIRLFPHKDFRLIVRKVYSTPNSKALKYIFLDCRVENDVPCWHYDILQKSIKDEAVHPIHRDDTVADLLEKGYALIGSGCDDIFDPHTTIIEHRRKAS